MSLEQYKETECACEKCAVMCTRPCWGKPHEIKRLIDTGYGRYLMADYWASPDGDFFILCPALKGYERKRAPFLPIGSDGCIFWHELRCNLHELGMKPIEGRLAHHDQDDHGDIHDLVGQTWNNEEAQEMVRDWAERFAEEEIF